MITLKTVTIAAVLLAGGTSLATAQYGYPIYGYGYGYGAPLYDYAAPVADLAPPAYGYPAAPLYNYAPPAYAAPATAGTTVIVVNPAPAYTAPTVVSRPLYSYAPGYWGGYGWGGGYGRWRAGYWWR